MKNYNLIIGTSLLMFTLIGCNSNSLHNHTQNKTTMEKNVNKETASTISDDTLSSNESQSTTMDDHSNSEHSTSAHISMTYYYGDDNAENLLSDEIEVSELSPQIIFDILLEKEVINKSITVNTFNIKDTHITLDVDQNLSSILQNTGSAGEHIIMGSIINTFLDAYEANTMSITVDGNTLATGHNIYDYELTYYK